MKSVFPIAQFEELEYVLSQNPSEVLIGHKFLSRFGQMNSEEVLQVIHECHEFKISVVLDWDILMGQDVFVPATKLINELGLNNFHSIRVQDSGAFHWLMKNEEVKDIQLVLETGNHNWAGVEEWLKLGEGKLSRIALSSELPKEILNDYLTKIPIETEILTLGKILLFYTPRGLLSPHTDNREQIVASGTSCETPHKGFHLLENFHGTFMFHPKDICLMEHLPELEEAGLTNFRIDLRFNRAVNLDIKIQETQDVKSIWPNKLMKGYYNANRSDSVFPKLKNSRKQRRDKDYLGDVYEVKKGRYIALSLRNENVRLELGQKLRLETPDGKIKYLQVEKIWNSSWEECEAVEHNQLALIRHIGGVSVKTAVYLENAQQ